MSEEAKVEEKKEEAAEAKTDAAEAATEEKPQLEGKLGEFVDWIETISVLELSQLVKALEDRLGVSASAPMMAMAPGAAAGGGDAGAEEEKTEFDVVLKSPGGQKIAVIKEVRAITSLGLKEAKELVESAPKPIKEGVSKDEAEQLKTQLEGAGAEVEVK